MNKIKGYSPKVFYASLVLITIINLIQASSSELILDEAYYWYFSQELALGYFDHPPMVALLVAIGNTLFSSELGVRLFAPFLFSGSILLLWKTIEDPRKYKHYTLFILFILSVALFNAYGFFMVPDTPMVFFAALFWYAYKKFLANKSIVSVLLLAISMAAMMYSKYMAILLIGFILISNLKLLLNKRFLAAAILSLILYFPHLYWLYENDFVSLKYHLVGRADSQYKIVFTLEYLLGFILISGIAFPLIFKALFRYPYKNLFDRGMIITVIGIFTFFLFSSFNRRTQAQWPLLVLFPFIIITFTYALDHLQFRKWLKLLSVASLVLTILIRIAISNEHFSPIAYETHGNKRWVKELSDLADSKPVVFRNSYTEASMYMFYSGKKAFSLNGYPFRPNQYDLRNEEDLYRHQKVVYLSTRKKADSAFGITRTYRNRIWRGVTHTNFISWRKLKLSLSEDEKLTKQDSIDFYVFNPYKETIPVSDLYFYGLSLSQKKGRMDTLPISLSKKFQKQHILPGDSLKFKAFLGEKAKLKRASYFRVCISERNLLPFGFQGNIIPIR
ncbi:ArnT family glycosyltransferase [Ascidiimonas sp. W6]|uniref:ArnT family glycosyltransferase n=1 Tax=Ascidiimonas meishanensis TaxID=3128903 RepID=UPI0030EF46FF